jgi:hypothetical protein
VKICSSCMITANSPCGTSHRFPGGGSTCFPPLARGAPQRVWARVPVMKLMTPSDMRRGLSSSSSLPTRSSWFKVFLGTLSQLTRAVSSPAWDTRSFPTNLVVPHGKDGLRSRETAPIFSGLTSTLTLPQWRYFSPCVRLSIAANAQVSPFPKRKVSSDCNVPHLCRPGKPSRFPLTMEHFSVLGDVQILSHNARGSLSHPPLQ